MCTIDIHGPWVIEVHTCRPTYKCEDAINANAISPPDSQLLNSQLKYYVRGDESRRAQNAIIEFAISLKTQSFYYTFKCGPTAHG